ncbi:hypothetical protein BST61_g6247 [Cercospora zeina]
MPPRPGYWFTDGPVVLCGTELCGCSVLLVLLAIITSSASHDGPIIIALIDSHELVAFTRTILHPPSSILFYISHISPRKLISKTMKLKSTKAQQTPKKHEHNSEGKKGNHEACHTTENKTSGANRRLYGSI